MKKYIIGLLVVSFILGLIAKLSKKKDEASTRKPDVATTFEELEQLPLKQEVQVIPAPTFAATDLYVKPRLIEDEILVKNQLPTVNTFFDDQLETFAVRDIFINENKL